MARAAKTDARALRVLLVKPKARLRTVLGLEGFQLLEPLELGYLAAAVPPPHTVRALDLRLCGFADRALRRWLSRFRPDIVGISGYTHEASEVKRLARLVRRSLPAARIVVGGHHATVAARDLDTPAIDAIVRGEGCGPFAVIVARIAAGEDLLGIPNVLLTGERFDEAFAYELADALAARGVAKRYFAWTRSTTVNRSPELLARWREVGLDGAFLGFEFPTDEELHAAGKGSSVAANERAHTTLRGLGIAVHAAFMVRPSYGEREFGRLREFVRAMPPAQCSFTVCTPSPGTPDYEALRYDVWVDNPFDLHDCMHPLTRTALPLREFSRLFAEQVGEGVAKTPLRAVRRPIPPADMVRVIASDRRYRHAFRTLYRDYPRDLWA